MKKLLSLILSLLMVFSLVPAFAISASALNEDTVAVIGDTEYTSLFGTDGALENVSEGETIVLVNDVKEQASVTIDKEITIDLAGYSIITYGEANPITNTALLKVRSTVDGLGETRTQEKAKWGYSGTLFTTEKGFDIDNVDFYERDEFPEWADTNYLEGVEWMHARYRTDRNDEGVYTSTYDNYTRECTQTLIDVEPGKTYYFGVDADKDTFGLNVVGFTFSDGTYTKTNLGSFVNATYTLSEASTVTKIGINIYCSNNEWSYNNSKTKILPYIGTTIRPIMADVTNACKYTSGNTFASLTADNILFKLNNVTIDQSTGTSKNINLTKGCNFDVTDFKFVAKNTGGQYSFVINSNQSSGTFKNSTFAGNNSHALKFINTSESGITLDNCTVTTSGDGGKTALIVEGGFVSLIGGTCGNNYASNNTSITGGTVYIDGTTFNGAKAGTALNISASADVTINKATFVKSPKTVNDKDIFYNSLAPDRAVYTSTEKSADTIVVKEKDINTLDKFYVDVCGHYISDATCEADGTCRSCGGVAPALGHDNTILKYNETQHWYECTRCDHVEPAEDHDDGQEGKTATCEKKPICALCKQEYGTPLGHSFTNFVAVEPARCPHNTVKVATCDNGCGKKEYNYDEATNTYVSREGKAPTCTEIGWTDELSCKLCEDDVVIKPREVIQATGHTYGEEIVDTEPTYRTTGKAHKICEVCDYVYEYELPVLEYPRGVVAVIGETGEQQYKSLFEADGAIADAEDGDTIVLVGDTEEYTPINLDKNITIDLAGHKLSVSTEVTSITATANLTVKSTVNGDGEENTAEMGILEFSKTFIQSNAEVTFDNIQAIASENVSIFTSTTADDAETPAKLTVKNSVFTVTKTSSNMSPIGFASKAVVVDFDTVTVQSGSDGEGVVLNSDVTGTFKNTIFKKAKGLSVSVKKTGADGIVFDGCTISQSAYDQNTCSISGGKCTLTGGTVVTGGNCSTTVLGMSGGTLIIDDAIIRDDKGTDSNRRLLYIGADGLDIQIKKATFSRGKSNGANGVICNDKARFIAALAEGSAMYYSEEATGECAFNYNDENATLLKEKVIYVAECKHEITTATCTEAGNCKYCNKEFAALGHDELGYASDGEYHWKACSRCGQAVDGAEKVAHSGGTATCTEPKHCEICEAGYGEALGHDFSEGKYVCNATSHWITCSRCTAKQEGTIAEHQVPADDNTSKAATCTEAAYCAECGLSYGKELGHEFKEVDYVYDEGSATCTENGTQTAKCTRCDETDTKEAPNTALGHSPVVVPAVPATCTHTGLTAGEKCATCGEILKQQAETPISKYHTWDEGKLTQQGSCQKHGVLTYTCIYCRTTEDVDVGLGACVESADWTITKQPTETETGLRVKYCTECGKVVKTEIVPAKGVTTPTQPNNPTVQNPTSNSSNSASTKVTVKAPNVKYTASKKSFKVKYTKVKNAVGFQVRYKIGKKTYTKTFNSTKNATKVIKNLKKGTYKVQIRAFSKGKKSFSKWTKAKTVKVK